MSDVLVQKSQVLKGGEFLVKSSLPEDTFIPEEINEDQRMIYNMVRDFLHQEIFPNYHRIEKQEPGFSASLLEKMGELGLLSAHIPEAYGGMGLDTNTNTFIGDALGPAGSFTVSFAAHIGIGMLPIFYFGTEAQ
ncbi:MAG TPA: acyl-CoA dehydrogenase family protein, partial [Saprospiraceae bacterium]|nr:acyl-CoA dehydrogenase family protein [Saprospiraceae bacterium]